MIGWKALLKTFAISSYWQYHLDYFTHGRMIGKLEEGSAVAGVAEEYEINYFTSM